MPVALLALCLAVAALLPSGRAALAHAVLVRASPAPNARLTASPPEIDLFFSEALDRRFSTIQVRDATNTPVSTHGVRFTGDPTEMDLPLPILKSGYYVVEWTTVSRVDGHKLQGSFPVTLLNPDGSLPSGAPPLPAVQSGSAAIGAVDVALRWLLLLAIVVVSGGFVLGGLLLAAAGSLTAPECEAAQRWSLRFVGIAACTAGAVAALVNLEILARQADQVGGPTQLGAILATRSGLYWSVREAAALVVCAVAYALVSRRQTLRRRARRSLLIAGGALAAVAVATVSLTSHAAAGDGAGWAVPIDFVHVSGVAVWLGSLLLLPALLLRPLPLAAGAAARFRAGAVARFSFLASIAIAAVALSGLFSASIEVGSLRNFTTTDYGRTLLIKVGLALPAFALGGWNALRVVRRVEHAGGEGRAAYTLGRLALVEALFGLCVLVATAALVLAVPGKQAAAQKHVKLQPSAATGAVFRNTAPAGDLQVTLVVSPNRPGTNDFTVSLSGAGVDQVTRVELRFQSADQSSGLSTLDMAAVGGGQYQAQAANLTFAGRWQVSVNVRRNGFDDVNGNFTVEVPGANAATAGPARPGIWDFPLNGISADQAVGVLLVAFALLILRLGGRVRLGRWARRAQRATIGLLLFAGASLFFAVHSHGSSSASVLTNPVPADQRSIDDGYQLFQANCAQCHGVTGHGDGPLAAGLNPKPFDLTVHVGLHPDWQLYDWITNGIPPTAMPAWKNVLDEQQRWDLVNYLRTLSAAAGRPGFSAPLAANVR